MNDSYQEYDQKRREAIFSRLEPGFTLKRRGRSGFLYYKTRERMLELYTEMSGVPEYHYLIWEEGLKHWVFPEQELVSSEDRTRISQELGEWLKEQGHQTDFKG